MLPGTGLGNIYVVSAPLDEQLKTLKQAGAVSPYFISARNTAYARLQGQLTDRTRTCHAPIYTKGEKPILLRVSPLVTNQKKVQQAVQDHKSGKWYTEDSAYERVYNLTEKDKSKEPEKRRAIILPSRQTFQLTQDSDIAKFLFQDIRERYFDEVLEGKQPNFYLISSKDVDDLDSDIVNYLCFYSVGNDSSFNGNNRYLGYGGGGFGVSQAAKGSAAARKKSGQEVRAYTLKEISLALTQLGFSGLEDLLMNKLKNPEKQESTN